MVDKKVENEAGIINCGRVIIANVKEYTVLGEKPHSERNRARRKHRAPRVSPWESYHHIYIIPPVSFLRRYVKRRHSEANYLSGLKTTKLSVSQYLLFSHY